MESKRLSARTLLGRVGFALLFSFILGLAACRLDVGEGRATRSSVVYWCRLKLKRHGVEQSRRMKLPIAEHQRQVRTAQPAQVVHPVADSVSLSVGIEEVVGG